MLVEELPLVLGLVQHMHAVAVVRSVRVGKRDAELHHPVINTRLDSQVHLLQGECRRDDRVCLDGWQLFRLSSEVDGIALVPLPDNVVTSGRDRRRALLTAKDRLFLSVDGKDNPYALQRLRFCPTFVYGDTARELYQRRVQSGTRHAVEHQPLVRPHIVEVELVVAGCQQEEQAAGKVCFQIHHASKL